MSRAQDACATRCSLYTPEANIEHDYKFTDTQRETTCQSTGNEQYAGMTTASPILFLVLISVALLSGCATLQLESGETAILSNRAASDTLIAKVGRPFFIQLEGNPTTGYEWVYRPDESGKVSLTQQSFSPDSNSEELAGVGGTYTFEFMPNLSGAINLKLEYLRQWEDVPPARSKFIKVQITQ